MTLSLCYTQGQQRQIFGDALQFWADVSGLTFSEVSSASSANIKIRRVNLSSLLCLIVLSKKSDKSIKIGSVLAKCFLSHWLKDHCSFSDPILMSITLDVNFLFSLYQCFNVWKTYTNNLEVITALFINILFLTDPPSRLIRRQWETTKFRSTLLLLACLLFIKFIKFIQKFKNLAKMRHWPAGIGWTV